ncbi:MAG: sugar phosphate isomerase/epimerase [Anaerolineaceae bacterium]|nr:sugar phosphate isomerase/epimerase [Anaerolineaceae bacterium]
MNHPIELMNLFWTTAGIFPGQAEISRFDFIDRVAATANAGFKGIGIWHADLEHILQFHTLKGMKRILDDHGIKYVELEFLNDWFLEGARKDESDSRKKRLFEASQVLHAKHVKIGDFYSSVAPMNKIIDAFGSLCAEAKQYNATIGFEIMVCSMINQLGEAINMVEKANVENGGLILDIYQVANLGMTYEEISRIPLKHLINVELNDGTLPDNPNHDPSNRCFCGDGEYDIHGFIYCIQQMGYAGPWAVEVISESLCKLPLNEMSTRSYTTTLAQFRS